MGHPALYLSCGPAFGATFGPGRYHLGQEFRQIGRVLATRRYPGIGQPPGYRTRITSPAVHQPGQGRV